MTLADTFAAFADGLSSATIPESAARHAATLVLDAVGCALDGWAASETRHVVGTALSLSGPARTDDPAVLPASGSGASGGTAGWAASQPRVTIIGSDLVAAPLSAVLANAYLITAVTECDVYLPAHCHLTPEIVPVALAMAELGHASGQEFRTAVVAGLEVASRLLRSLDYPEFRRRGWHSPGNLGPVGAAVAAGKLLGLDPAGLRTAMSLAVTQAAGTFAGWPTTAVKFHQANGAAAGLLAAELAAAGFTASPEPFEAADGGLFATRGPGDLDAALAGLGESWELEQISLRLWPGATPVQPLLTALLTGQPSPPEPAEIRTAEIRVCPATYEAHRGLAHPEGNFEALLSFHYVAAAALVHGRFGVDLADPAGPHGAVLAAFSDEHLTLAADPELPRGSIVVTMTCHDGRVVVIRQDHALGSPSMRASEAAVQAKFLAAARSQLPADTGLRLMHALLALDQQSDVADVAMLARSPVSHLRQYP